MDMQIPIPAPSRSSQDKSKEIKVLKPQKFNSAIQKKPKRVDNGSGTSKSSKLYGGLMVCNNLFEKFYILMTRIIKK